LAARKSSPLALSAISLWEIAWLAGNKRIVVDVSVDSFVKKCASYVQIFPITPEIAVRSVQFPKSYPNDPQDRITGATAIIEGLRLLTSDKLIVKSAWFLWRCSGSVDPGSSVCVRTRTRYR
jgi:PIN domain nuclease of toxin-antitoxin system